MLQRIFHSHFQKWLTKMPLHLKKSLWLHTYIHSGNGQECFHSWIYKRRSKNGHFSFGSVHLDICGHSDHTPLQNKTTGSRLPMRAGLHLIPFDPGTVLCNESTKDQTQQPWYVLSGNKHQKIICQCGQYSLIPFCVAVSMLYCLSEDA